MKKLSIALCLVFAFINIKAQIPWNTDLNDGSSNPKLGTVTNDPLNFYANDKKLMSLVPAHGTLQLDSLAGDGDRVVVVDENGHFKTAPQVNGAGGPCETSAMPWSQGGNNTPNTVANRAGTCNNVDFVLKAYDKESIFLKPDGKVGIGLNNSSPGAPIDFFDGSDLGNSDHIKFYPDASGTMQSTAQMNLSSGTDMYLNSTTEMYLNYGSGTALTINDGATPVLILSSAGNYLYGGLSATQNMVAKGFQSVSATNTNVALEAINSSTSKTNFAVFTSGQTLIGTQTNAANAAMLNINLNSSNTGSSADNAFDVYDQSSQKINFRVKASGFVYAKEINVQLSTFPDYVFNNSYKLRSLESLEKYIQQNKHLPNVPTASEIEKDGANLGELSRIQMEKIEELTLYVIELKKEVEELKKQVNR